MSDGCVKRCWINELSFFRVASDLVHLSINGASFGSATCEKSSETIGPMVTTVTGVDVGCTTEFRSQNNHCFLQKTTNLKVKEQRLSLVNVHAVCGN